MPAQDLGHAFTSLGTALGLGLLVGLQRQRAGSSIAGVRTFALVTLLGAVAALLTATLGVWPIAATLLGVTALAVTRNAKSHPATTEAEDHAGLATEIAMLLMVDVGVLVVLGPREVAVAVAGCAMVLLHAKLRLHDLARRISDRDFSAIVQFALITLVILPVLPDQAFGPYAVLNPHHIWLMVVLIVGINLGAYLLRKLLGPRAGLIVNGLLGGLVSSTATTASAARQAHALARPAAPALVAAVAGAVVLPRVASVIAVAAPRVLSELWEPLGLLLAAFVVSLAFGWWRLHREGIDLPESTNPAELRGAILFGVVFAAVLLAAAWALDKFGRQGLLAVAAISGLTDVDAITLSTARIVQETGLDPRIGAAGIVVAILSNMLFKLGVAGFLGGRRFFRRSLTLLGPVLVVGSAWLVLRVRG